MLKKSKSGKGKTEGEVEITLAQTALLINGSEKNAESLILA